MPPHANSKIILLKICYNFNFLVFFLNLIFYGIFSFRSPREDGATVKKSFSYFSVSEKVQKRNNFGFEELLRGC